MNIFERVFNEIASSFEEGFSGHDQIYIVHFRCYGRYGIREKKIPIKARNWSDAIKVAQKTNPNMEYEDLDILSITYKNVKKVIVKK